MKINLDEICRGYSETLEKQAVGAYLPPPPSPPTTSRSYLPSVDLENMRWLNNGPGKSQSYIHPGPLFGIPDAQLPEALYDLKNKDNINISNTPFLKYINKNRAENMASQSGGGAAINPFLHTADMAVQAFKWGGGRFLSKAAPDTWDNIQGASDFADATRDLVTGTKDKAYDALGVSASNRKTYPELFKQFKQMAHDYRYNPENFKNSLGALKNNAQDQISDFLTFKMPPKDYIVPGLAIAGTGALIHQMYKSQADKKAKAKAKAEAALAAQQAAQQAVKAQAQQQQQLAARSTPQTHIYNIMPRTPMGFGADAYTKYGSEKTADMVDALASSVGRRVADKVLTQAIGAPSAPKEEHKEKEIEITSKYPEMEKMLKKKKNKEYLEKLLKD